jgi:hypothetical protein
VRTIRTCRQVVLRPVQVFKMVNDVEGRCHTAMGWPVIKPPPPRLPSAVSPDASLPPRPVPAS